MTNTDVVKKLIGNIVPYGDTEIDENRMQNMKEMCVLVNDLLQEIKDVYRTFKNSPRASEKEIAECAKNWLKHEFEVDIE